MPDKLRWRLRYKKHVSHDQSRLCDGPDIVLGRIIIERPIFGNLQLLANLHSDSIDMCRCNFNSLVHHNYELRQLCFNPQFPDYLCAWCLHCWSFCKQLSCRDLHCPSKSNNAFRPCFHSYWNYLVCTDGERSMPLSSNDFLNSSRPHL